jgi:hypothetical protein
VFEGFPELFAGTTRSAHQPRRSLSVVVYRLLGDLVNACQHALIHHLPLSLEAPCLQSIPLGTAYQEWAKLTNEDFQKVDECLQRIVPAAWNCYYETGLPSKLAWRWFWALKKKYASCVVNPGQPFLTISTVSQTKWADPEQLTAADVSPDSPVRVPTAVAKATFNIADRRKILELQSAGLLRVQQMREFTAKFGEWLSANCTMEQITATYRGIYRDDSME